MKLIRYGDQGAERPATMQSGSDVVLDARPVTSDFDQQFFESGGLDRLAAAVATGELDELAHLRL